MYNPFGKRCPVVAALIGRGEDAVAQERFRFEDRGDGRSLQEALVALCTRPAYATPAADLELATWLLARPGTNDVYAAIQCEGGTVYPGWSPFVAACAAGKQHILDFFAETVGPPPPSQLELGLLAAGFANCVPGVQWIVAKGKGGTDVTPIIRDLLMASGSLGAVKCLAEAYPAVMRTAIETVESYKSSNMESWAKWWMRAQDRAVPENSGSEGP